MKKILVFAPHPDDEILGCGGTIIKNIAKGNEVYVCIATRGSLPLFDEKQVETVRNEALECHKALGVKKTFFLDFPAVMMEECHRYEINGKVMNVVKEVQPDIVYIPHYGDMQRDHMILAEACMVALRPKYFPQPKVLGYETMSETAWNTPNIQNEFIPNVFEDISDYLVRKLEALSYFKSQVSDFPDARSLESIEALAKYRGANLHRKACEAFMLIREVLD